MLRVNFFHFTRSATRAWECGGAMLWRLDENAVGIVDERACGGASEGTT